MFHGEEKSEDGHGDPRVGVSVQQAEKIAVNNMIGIGVGSIVVFYLIYKYLIK